jgi:hypothetical protein
MLEVKLHRDQVGLISELIQPADARINAQIYGLTTHFVCRIAGLRF